MPERVQNRFEHALTIIDDIAVPKADDAPSVIFEPSGPEIIRNVLDMLAAVDFNDQPIFETNEIHDVGTDGPLAPDFVAEQPAVTKHKPKPALGIS